MAQAYFAAQENLLTRIKSSYSSFKKGGVQKMTEGACLVQMERLDKLWNSFETNHAALNEMDDVTGKEEYYRNDVFEKAE